MEEAVRDQDYSVKMEISNRIWIMGMIALLVLPAVISQAQDKVFVIKLNYKTQYNVETLELVEIFQSDGTPISYGNPSDGYRLDMSSADGQTVGTFRFNIPVKEAAFKGLSNDISGDSNNLYFTLYLPYSDKVSAINVYDPSGKQKLVIPIELKPGFESETDERQPRLLWFYISMPVFVVLLLAFYEFKRIQGNKGLMSQRNQITRESLRNYVKTSLGKGFKKEQIRNALVKSKYSNKEIEEAFKGLR